jgi:teichuronic acid biosynthesis glycosyltransferase TuaC
VTTAVLQRNGPLGQEHLASRIKLAVVVEAFPTSDNVFAGVQIQQKLSKFTEWAEVIVYYGRPSYARSESQKGGTTLSEKGRSNGLPVQRVYFPAARLLSRPFNGRSLASRLLPLLQDQRPDAILAFYLYPQGYASVVLGGKLGVPVIMVAMGSDLRQIRDPATKKLTAKAVRRADCILAVSEDLRQRAIDMGAIPQRVHRLPNGYNPSVFRPLDQTLARQQLGVAADAELIVFVGRLIALKGLDDLIRAVQILSPMHPRLRVVCIGEGTSERHLRHVVQQEGLTKTFDLIGPKTQPEIAHWLAACNLFCLPSHSEGSPNVITEALACGRPVVATEVGGIPDLVDSSSGILVKPGDVAALARGLDQALVRAWNTDTIVKGQKRTWSAVSRDVHACVCGVLDQHAAAHATSSS